MKEKLQRLFSTMSQRVFIDGSVLYNVCSGGSVLLPVQRPDLQDDWGNRTSIATVLDLIQARGGMWKTFDNV